MFHFGNAVEMAGLPETLLRAQLNYLRHYRETMRSQYADADGRPAPHLWHWAVMFQPEDLSKVPSIEAGPAKAIPRWMDGNTLAIVVEETGEILAWSR